MKNSYLARTFRVTLISCVTVVAFLGFQLLSAIPAYADSVVVFPDPEFDAIVRSVIGKPTGDIYQSDLLNITSLNLNTMNPPFSHDHDHGWSFSPYLALCGIFPNLQSLSLSSDQIGSASIAANLPNLRYLDLSENDITDISPLANLTNLQHLDLGDNFHLTNITALANLTNLQYLELGGNDITDISPLANLTNLQHLGLYGNKIVDISPLANLTNLQYLELGGNDITDISPLANLINLHFLDIQANQISNIDPLVENKGIGVGDTVNLNIVSFSSSQMADIRYLLNRKVNVNYSPLTSPDFIGPLTWYLDSTGNPVMEQTGRQLGSVDIAAGSSMIWLSDQPAEFDATFTNGNWTIKLSTNSNGSGTCSAQVGDFNPTGSGTFTPFNIYPMTGSYYNYYGILTITITTHGTVSQNDYLALKIFNRSGSSLNITTDGNSYLNPPSSTPNYPTPEMPAIALFSIGLVGLSGYVLIRRKKIIRENKG